ncbi:MAG TPA: DUF5668 domain-containing protein [Anaerolineaceae bacterium]|nr:DUF5668 domain-containing protein [Anaerolineaceae bacterium]
METKRQFSFFWPLLLIAVGVILVLSNLGAIPGDGWALILRLWPVLFIIGGLDELFRREGWAGAVVMIGLGTVLLLGNLGYLRMGALELLLRLWPVFLIALGLDILFRGSSLGVSILGGLVAIALVALVVWFAFTAPVGGVGNVQAINQELGDASQAEVLIDPAVGNLTVAAAEAGDALVSGQVNLSRNQQVEDDYRLANGTARYALGSEGDAVFIPFAGFGLNMLWDLDLSPAVPVDLRTTLGVGRQEIDLTGLEITDLTVDTALGSTELTLPAEGPLDARVKTALGNTVIWVPEGASVRIDIDTGITVVDLPDGYRRVNDTILSPGASEEEADIQVFAESPMGVLRVETLP